MKAKDLRAMDETKQRTELQSMLREQFNLRMQHATGQLPNNANLKKVRRDIARLRTVMGERKKPAKEPSVIPIVAAMPIDTNPTESATLVP